MHDRQEMLFAASTDPGEVFAVLSSRYTAVADPRSSATWTCLDSADWGLHRAGLTLRAWHSGRRRELVLDTASGERLSAPAGPGPWPRLVAAIPASPLRDRIAPALGIRALLPLVEIDSTALPIRLLDDQGKTRVRVRVDHQRLAGPSPALQPLRVLITPLRGYERDGQWCAELLTGRLPVLIESESAVHTALIAAGHQPGPRPDPPSIEPASPVHEALAGILLHQLDAMASARPGMLADVDTEFLHDYRVAVRATRSVLRIGGERLPGEFAARYGAEFAWLGQVTSAVRDLDVWLLMLDGHGEIELADLPSVQDLRSHLLTRRRRELRAMRAALGSPRAAQLEPRWRAALEQLRFAEVFTEATATFAAREAQRAYRRIARDAQGVTLATPADDLHTLRKRCKRMRYLLDGFRSVLEPGAVTAVHARLKKVQTCLGDIQDCDVQRRELTGSAAALNRAGAPVEVLLALGALGERVAQRERRARHELGARLAELTGADVTAAVTALAGVAT